MATKLIGGLAAAGGTVAGLTLYNNYLIKN